MRTQTILTALVLCASTQGQTLVSGGGVSLRNAVDAAADNDILEVAPGTYEPFVVRAGKALTIIAPQRAVVQRLAGSNFPGFDILNRGSLRMVGFDCRRTADSLGNPTGGGFDSDMSLVSTPHVVLENCTFEGPLQFRGGEGVLVRSLVTALDTPALVIVNGRVTASDSQLLSEVSPIARVSTSGGVFRAERTVIQAIGAGPSSGEAALSVDSFVPAFITLADCIVVPEPGAASIQTGSTPGGDLQFSNLQAPGGIVGSATVTPTPLATASMDTTGILLGRPNDFSFGCAPLTPIAAVFTWGDVVSPIGMTPFAQPVFVFATPLWLTLSVGLTDTDGRYNQTITIPAGLGFEFVPTWCVSVALAGGGIQTSIPIGGVAH